MEIIEEEREWHKEALKWMYDRLLDGRGWVGEPLKVDVDGYPCIHDVLERLRSLRPKSVEWVGTLDYNTTSSMNSPGIQMGQGMPERGSAPITGPCHPDGCGICCHLPYKSMQEGMWSSGWRIEY